MKKKIGVVIGGLFILLMCFLLIIYLFILVDDAFFNSKNFNKIVYGSDCNYEVPAGYKIVYSENKKKYAVKVLLTEDYYLHNGRGGITTTYSYISEPSLFEDSCGAKAYLKAYIKQIQPKFYF